MLFVIWIDEVLVFLLPIPVLLDSERIRSGAIAEEIITVIDKK